MSMVRSEKLLVRVDRDAFNFNGVSIYLAKRIVDCGVETVAIVQPMLMEVVKDPRDCGTRKPPAIEMTNEDAQRLMDELYNAGIRPTEGVGSPGQVKALQDHLADMRKIVFESIVEFDPNRKQA